MPIMSKSLLAGLFSILSLSAAATEYRVADSIKGPDFRWDYLSVDAVARRLYMGRAGGVTSIDLDSGKVTPTLLVSKLVHGVAPLGDSGVAAATNGLADSVTLFRGDSGEVLAEIPAGKGPDCVLYEPATKTILVFNEDSHDVTIIDAASHDVLATLPLGGQPEFAAADGKGLVYDNIVDKREIAVIDVAARKIIRHIPLKSCEEPTGIAYDGASGLVISVCGSGAAKFIDAKSGKEVSSLKIGKGGDAVILDETRRLVFFPTGASGTLSVASLNDGGKVALKQTLKTKTGVRTGALDPASGRLYLPSADFLKPSKAGEWPPVAPGSLKILVVAPD